MDDASRRTLRVVVGCDTDPDRLDFGGIPFNAGARPQIWRGVDCIGSLRERWDGLLDDFGRPLAITWFLRCDEQMRVTEGDYSAPIGKFSDLWRRCVRSGDEIGWHPHLWRLANDGLTWFHETNDEVFQKQMLEEAHRAFTRAWGAVQSVRMGWDYHNNATMGTLDALGIRIDLSALPHQSYGGATNDRGASFAGCYDWSTTGTVPYRPSRADYRVPGEDRLDILELPQGLLRSRTAALLAAARGAVRDRSPRQLWRALHSGRTQAAHLTVKATSPTFLFRAMVRDILQREEGWVVTYFHPDELLPRKGQFLNDLIHRASYLERNIRTLLREASRAGCFVRFLTAGEAAAELSR